MDNNGFLGIKVFVTGVCAAFSAAFGWVGVMIVAWVACMVIDWITGSAAAAKAGNWSSKIAREGIFHKAGELVVVMVAAIADCIITMAAQQIPAIHEIGITIILPIVLVWYIVTEAGSILENAAALGAPVPGFLVKILAATKKAAETAAGKSE
jgi:toxin secretion/phage lysis holin